MFYNILIQANERSKTIEVISEQNRQNIRAGMPIEDAEPSETTGTSLSDLYPLDYVVYCSNIWL